MDVKIPEECSAKEFTQIEKVLEKSIADSLELIPEDIDFTVDPKTGEASYDISVDDPTRAEEIEKVLKNDDFVQNVNKSINENSENLPQRIHESLEIKDVNPDKTIVREARDLESADAQKTTESDEESEFDSDVNYLFS